MIWVLWVVGTVVLCRWFYVRGLVLGRMLEREAARAENVLAWKPRPSVEVKR